MPVAKGNFWLPTLDREITRFRSNEKIGLGGIMAGKKFRQRKRLPPHIMALKAVCKSLGVVVRNHNDHSVVAILDRSREDLVEVVVYGPGGIAAKLSPHGRLLQVLQRHMPEIQIGQGFTLNAAGFNSTNHHMVYQTAE